VVPSKWMVRPLFYRRSESIATSINSLECGERLPSVRRTTAGVIMWAWAIGSFSLAAVVNQIAIALWWRALAATDTTRARRERPSSLSSPARCCREHQSSRGFGRGDIDVVAQRPHD
jgi:hypothetical protein